MKNNKVAAKQAKNVRQMGDHKAPSSDLQFTMEKHMCEFFTVEHGYDDLSSKKPIFDLTNPPLN